jgi:hypothetical protein
MILFNTTLIFTMFVVSYLIIYLMFAGWPWSWVLELSPATDRVRSTAARRCLSRRLLPGVKLLLMTIVAVVAIVVAVVATVEFIVVTINVLTSRARY